MTYLRLVALNLARAVVLLGPRGEAREPDSRVFMSSMDGVQLSIVARLPEDRCHVEGTRTSDLHEVQRLAREADRDVLGTEQTDRVGDSFVGVDILETERHVGCRHFRFRFPVGPRPGDVQREDALEMRDAPEIYLGSGLSGF